MKSHWATRRGNVFALTISRKGTKIKPTTAENSSISTERNTPPEQLIGASYTIKAERTSMLQFAESLSKELERPVSDLTGLKGEFDFHFTYSTPDDPDGGPQLSTAVAQQLGLKLRPKKGEITTLVIDHIERPSEN
jgi:uncharacterized protein (TIGR03435 family)